MKLLVGWISSIVPVAAQSNPEALTVVHAKDERIPRPEIREIKRSPVEPMGIPRCSLSVDFWGETYEVEADHFNFGPLAVHARVAITLPGRWRVVSSDCGLMLVHNMRPCDCESEMIAIFANAGLIVKREFVRACLDPLTLKIIDGAQQIFAS